MTAPADNTPNPAPRERDGHCEPDCPYLRPGDSCEGHCALLDVPLVWYDYHLSECGREQRAIRAHLERLACRGVVSLELEEGLLRKLLDHAEKFDAAMQKLLTEARDGD